MTDKVGFIGLGKIGTPMAMRIVETAGRPLTVWGRTPEKLAPAINAGATSAPSAQALTEAVDVVITCVTDAPAMEDVVFGPAGIAAGAAADKLLVDCSSIHPERARALAARLTDETGMGWVDAPVSGGVPGAQAGTLAVMAGGTAADVDRMRLVVDPFAGRITHMGDVGAGQTTKLCNQIILNATLAGIAEALGLARAAGVDAAALPDCLAGGWADSPLLQDHARRMAAGTFPPPGFSMWLKDMDTACDVGRINGASMPVSALITELVRLAKARTGDTSQIAIMRLHDGQP